MKPIGGLTFRHPVVSTLPSQLLLLCGAVNNLFGKAKSSKLK
jgi:hypothetical protein